MLHSRKGALLLLVVAVFWSALPLGACLLADHASGRTACCTEMAQDCPMQGTDMNAPCCPTHTEDAAMVPEAPVALEHGTLIALPPHPATVPMLAVSADGIRYVPGAPPPDTSPGAISVLRI